MNLNHGPLSLSRFQFRPFTEVTLTDINKAFQPYTSRPIKLEGKGRELQLGWTKPLSLATFERPEDSWEASDGLMEAGILLCMRVERRRLPSQLLQTLLRERMVSLIESDKKVSKQNAKEELRLELLGKSLPSISYCEAYWHDDGSLVVMTANKTMKEHFCSLFLKTFEKILPGELVDVLPPLLAFSAKRWHPQDHLFETVNQTLPSSFWLQ